MVTITAGIREYTGRPVKTNFGGRPLYLSRLRFSGPGAPARIQPLLAQVANVGLQKDARLMVGPQTFVIERVETGGVPVVRLAHTEKIERTFGDTTFSYAFDNVTALLHLMVKSPDYFGFSQEVTYAAIEAGLAIEGLGARHERLAGSSQVELTCQLKEGNSEHPIDAFDRFVAVLSKRIETYNHLGRDGKQILFTYHNLISACGRFLSTFPQLPDSPLVGVKAVEEALLQNPQLAQLMVRYLRTRFDDLFANYYGTRSSDLHSLVVRIKNDLSAVADPREKQALSLVFQFLQAVEKTNAFNPQRNPEVIVFKLNRSAVQKIADHFNVSYPTDITYVYSTRTGSYAIGARFGGEVSKGGDRYYFEMSADGKFKYTSLEAIDQLSLQDALRLADTQETKNLLWGCYVNGLKTVLVTAPPVKENAPLDEVQAAVNALRDSQAYALIRDAWLELKGEDLDHFITQVLATNDRLRIIVLLLELIKLENLVNLSLGECYLENLGDKRPGPDVNMSPFHMEFLTVVAKHLGVPNWDAIYTGKSAQFGGFPHRQLKVTGRGIFTNLQIAMEKLGLDPAKREVSATVQGFGDVGSSMVHFLLTETPAIKLTAVTDDSGMLVCSGGLGAYSQVRDELLRLAREEKKLSEFNPALLVDGVEFIGKERIGEVITMPATIFIPAAVSNVITEGNVDAVLANHELVVEAANIPFAVEAAKQFDAHDGRRIPGDFANGGGVLTSTNEILAVQILGQDEFKARFETLAVDNEALVVRTAQENSRYLWDQFKLANGCTSFVALVKKVTRSMMVVKNIVKVSALIYDNPSVYSLLFDSLFPSIVATIDRDEIIERLGPSIVKELVAAQLARKIIFAHDAEWFGTISPSKRDEVILVETRQIIADRASRPAA